MRKIIISTFFCLLITFLILTMMSCGTNSTEGTYPPDSDKLSKMIGSGKSETFKELGIGEEDAEYEHLEYRLTKKAEYLGYSFDEILKTDASTENEELYGFAYRLVFKNDTDEMTESMKAVMKELEMLYGSPDDDYAKEWSEFGEYTEGKASSEKMPNGSVRWKLSDELELWFTVSSHSEKDAGMIQTLELQYRIPDPRISEGYQEITPDN